MKILKPLNKEAMIAAAIRLKAEGVLHSAVNFSAERPDPYQYTRLFVTGDRYANHPFNKEEPLYLSTVIAELIVAGNPEADDEDEQEGTWDYGPADEAANSLVQEALSFWQGLKNIPEEAFTST